MTIIDTKVLRKILVPTDFSSAASRALNYAASLSVSLNSEIVVFHVIDVPVVSTNDMAFPVNYSELEQNAVNLLEKTKTEIIAKYGNLKISTVFTIGIATQEILQKSLKEGFDLVVMGTQGKSGMLEVVFGSVTKNIIGNCPCPVLVVPDHAPNNQPSKIAFATNFDDHELQSLFLLAELLRPFDTEINLVHIGDVGDMKQQDELLTYFRGQVRTNINYEKIRYHIISGKDVEDSLEQFIVSNKMDWIAIAKRKRNFFDKLTSRSLTNKLQNHSFVPILVFHTSTRSTTPFFS